MFLEHSSNLRVPGLNATFSTNNTKRVQVFFTEIETQQHFSQDHRHWHTHLWHLYPFYSDLQKIKGLWPRFKPLLWSVLSIATWNCTLLIQMPSLLVKFHCICRCISPGIFWWFHQKGVKVGWVGIKSMLSSGLNQTLTINLIPSLW